MRRGPVTEAAYRRPTKGGTTELRIGRSVGLGIGPGPAEGAAVQGPSDTGEGAAPPQRSKPGSGRRPNRVGPCPASACALEGAPGGKGVAGRGPSEVRGGAASPRRAEPGSGREPTRLRSCRAPAPSRARRRGQAAKALPGKGRATKGRAQPPPTGRTPN